MRRRTSYLSMPIAVAVAGALDAVTEPPGQIHWPAERLVDVPLVLDVGPGKPFRTVQSVVYAVSHDSTRRTLVRIQPGE